jgi:glycosyltransferase involved in cell wall biosynthesis
MKLAVITTHPIQYYAPWFKRVAGEPGLSARVFYLWDFGVTEQVDRGFGRPLKWDVSLLDGYDYEFVPNTSRRPGTHHLRGMRNPELVGRVRRYGPDAVLLLGYNYASLYEFILRWDRRKAPLLFRGDSHRLVTRRGHKERMRRRFIAAVFSRFARFLHVGKANQEYFRYHGVTPDRLFFAPHAVNNERFFGESERAFEASREWRRELGIPGGHQVVLFAGKFEEKKRPLDLLEAFDRSRPQSASLLFVGDGCLEPELRRRASGLGNVFFAPFQNQSMMPRTYAASDLFVLPSYGPGETWGLAVNEAMCLSRAVVASTHVGCAQDLIRSGSSGLVFEAGSVPALADALREALSDRPRLARWGAQGRRIVADYSYEETTRGLMKALESLG